ncbi:MAG: hypothetical protein AAGF48_14070 [Pseudomonadota bacterium]
MRTNTLLAATAIALAPAFASADILTAFDVAEDHTRIFMAAQPLHENGMPAHGNAFISQGYIYPPGTLQADTTGVLEDGSPAFPDLVLGTWTCDGYFVGEGGNAKSGVWIVSRQVFAFDDGNMITTDGTELADIGLENLRPVTGAKGDFADIEGGLIQTTLGFNDFFAINATFRLEIEDDRAENRSSGSAAEHRLIQNSEDDHLEWDSGMPVGPIDTSNAAKM